MKYYTPVMFDADPAMLEKAFPHLFARKETLEFQIKIYQEKFDEFKRINFPEMLVFEKRKEHTPELKPDKVVLDQFKKVESEPAVAEFRKTLTKLKRDLKNTEVEIEIEANNIKSMFSFKDKNYELYVNNLNKYYKGGMQFKEMMAFIFEKEFNKRSIFYEVAGLRNLPVLKLLYERAPVKCKDIMMNILQETKVIFMVEEYVAAKQYELYDEDGSVNKVKVMAMIQAEYERDLRGVE